jgi:hypothetical protein
VANAPADPTRLPLRVCGAVSGPRLEYVYEVVEHVPEKRFMMRTTEGPFPMETTYEWEPTETGTRMTLINRGTPSRDHTRSRARRAGDAMAADDGSRDSDHPVACRAA